MTDIETSKALALAIGYMPEHVRVVVLASAFCAGHGVLLTWSAARSCGLNLLMCPSSSR